MASLSSFPAVAPHLLEFLWSLDELALAVGLFVRANGAVRQLIDSFTGHIASSLASAFTFEARRDWQGQRDLNQPADGCSKLRLVRLMLCPSSDSDLQ
ncbi:hypothetical protein AC628_15175 [Bradyrhizobium sp. NAS96.2]|nr:hypothetical protein AC628_15175 [Bradyrhizobium sp. NAS96.2]